MAVKMKKKSVKMTKTILSIVFMIVTITGVFGYIIPAYNNAQNLGINMGDKTGKMVGNVIGSYNGITTGLMNGSEDGKEEALSAQDTESEIKSNFSEVGNLEVLEAGVKLKDVNTLGADYASLFLLKGVAIYSVNLKEAEINGGDSSTVEIYLPDIDVEVYIDESGTEKLAEYQKHSWSGSAKDGFVEYMNTREVTDKSVKDTLENYDALIEDAESSAKKQVGIIAKAATGNKKEVIVLFKREVQENE